LECKAGSRSSLYLMMQKRYEAEVTKLSQNNHSFFAVIYSTKNATVCRKLLLGLTYLSVVWFAGWGELV